VYLIFTVTFYIIVKYLNSYNFLLVHHRTHRYFDLWIYKTQFVPKTFTQHRNGRFRSVVHFVRVIRSDGMTADTIDIRTHYYRHMIKHNNTHHYRYNAHETFKYNVNKMSKLRTLLLDNNINRHGLALRYRYRVWLFYNWVHKKTELSELYITYIR